MSGTFNARKACEAVVARIGGGEVPFLHKSPDRPAFSGFAGIKKNYSVLVYSVRIVKIITSDHTLSLKNIAINNNKQ